MRRLRPLGVRLICLIASRAEPALDTDAVRYFGFPVAFVVAETFEQARAAAALVRIRYAPASCEYDLHAAAPQAENPGKIDGGAPADTAVGDFASAFAAAPVKIDAAYTTPYQHSAPMEPHASMAFWEEEMLTVCTAAQLTTSPREGLARRRRRSRQPARQQGTGRAWHLRGRGGRGSTRTMQIAMSMISPPDMICCSANSATGIFT
jgi:CO/xanthine dehydrogenase Mo-binding subunit